MVIIPLIGLTLCLIALPCLFFIVKKNHIVCNHLCRLADHVLQENLSFINSFDEIGDTERKMIDDWSNTRWKLYDKIDYDDCLFSWNPRKYLNYSDYLEHWDRLKESQTN